MTRSSRVWCTLAAVCAGTLSIGNALAAEFTLSGEVTEATGAFSALTPVGTVVGGPIFIDDGALGGTAGPGDIDAIEVNVGGFCFSTEDPSNCPMGGADVPIVSIDSAAIDLTALPVVGGNLDVTAFSPTFGINIPIFFDLTTGTFFADGGALGTVSGTSVLAPPPAPMIAAAPNPAEFMDTVAGMTDSLDVTVTNDGEADLTDIVVAGVDMLADPFSVTADGCSTMTLAMGQSCVIQLEFAPTAGGVFMDSFDIVSNDTANSPLTVTVEGTGLAAVIDVSPSPLAFTATMVGDSMLSTVTVTNDGGAQLDIGTLTAPGDMQFTVSNNSCNMASLAPMATCTFDVTFAPLAVGMFMTSLTIPSNASNDTMFELDISGTGVPADTAEIQLDREALDFGEIDLGQSAALNIVVTSTGTIPLEIDLAGLVVAGPDAADFSQTNNCPASLAPMATCTITVTFDPQSAGADKMAMLPVNSNAGMRPMIDVGLTGSAFLGARISVDPVELTFGSESTPVLVGNTETASTTVTNNGNDTLFVTNIVFAGGAGEFSLDSEDCTTGVAPGGTCTITVLFAPVTEGDKAGTMTIESNDADGLMPEVALTGFVFTSGAQISVSPNPAVFPAAAVGTVSTVNVTVRNTGQTELTDIVVAGVNMLAAPFSILSDGCAGATLANNQTCTIQLQFAPAAGGLFTDSFDIVSNDPVNPSRTVNVRGTGLEPGIAVTPAPLAFMATLVGESMVSTVTVTNDGDATLALGNVTAPADTQFTVSNNDCDAASLAPAATCSFDVTFAPTAAGMFMTSLTIPSNADPMFELDISGTGVAVPMAEIELSVESLIFDEIEVGQSATMDIVVTNTGNDDLGIDLAGLVTTGDDAADFTQTNDCPAVLAPMGICTITVTFEPLSGGADKTAILPVNSNAGMRPMIDVSLAGSAFQGARISVDPTELNFGGPSDPLELGATETASTTVTNSGNDDLVVTDILFDNSEFSVASEDCTAGVAPRATCTITVAFTPVTDGDKMATMTIESNDADGSTPEVSLTGFVFTGARIDPGAPSVNVSAGTTVTPGETSSVNIEVQSTGTQDLEIASVVLGGNDPDQFSINDGCSGTVVSGSSCTIGVTFAPTTAGLKSATITINSNDVTQQRQRAPTTVITVTGTALAAPPAFARSDEGGVGATGLWLLASGLGLLAIRRRRAGPARRMTGGALAGGIVALAATVMLGLPGEVRAISFESESGDIYGSWDTTVSYGLAYRLQAAADNLIGTVNGGTKFSVNGDDGTLNFHRGIYSNALKLTSELELNYSPANLSLFVRGFYFYDTELEDGTRDRTPLSPEALDLAGNDGDLLDAFVSWRFDIGERPAEFRVGEQVINWGESTFIQGGMNVINHINVAALRVPGAELREALLPQDLLFFSVGLTPNLDVEIVYQYDWDDTEPDAVGTYFSTNDFAVDGGEAVRLGFGDTPDFPNPAFYPEGRFFNAIPRGPDGSPSDDGQWGWAARYFAPDFNNGTEFGFYYYNYHSRLPLISARTGSFDGFLIAGAIGVNDEAIANAAINYIEANPGDTNGAIAAGAAAAPTVPAYASQGIAATAITRGFDTAIAIASAYTTDAFANTPSTGQAAPGYAPSPVGETAQFRTVFPEDIQLYGFSWNTTLGTIAWQGEIAHHQNRPLQLDDLEILFAGLSTLRGQFAQFGQLGSFSFFGAQANPDTPPLTDINGYYRRDYTQANMAFTQLFSRVFGADQAVALFEVAYHHVHGFPSKDVVRFDAAATVVSGNPDLAELAHPGKPILPPDVFPDANSWGYRLAGRLDYSNVFGTSFNMAPRFAWQHDVSGITPGPAGAFIEDRKALTIGNRFSYQNKWEFDISYSRFFGAGFQNEIHDRDFVAGSVKFTF